LSQCPSNVNNYKHGDGAKLLSYKFKLPSEISHINGPLNFIITNLQSKMVMNDHPIE